ncbi:COP9 signalosome complex subunit 6 [Pseudozyma hubeiensis SY62]|uniref:COP9 signalosome complex subunit 6 n=1 Tax=Pseudozyma hubeiensis (strain SY62) TaxID=1305764 RepID=R9PE27_PSEHS|nr:COP9 signalosome complex subunit 6 [Pseudozyma hubeiensis SY62]GAC99633.1 COP9 signalosome complex subunit 6 [Pseudozyma hubeiensis SY62]
MHLLLLQVARDLDEATNGNSSCLQRWFESRLQRDTPEFEQPPSVWIDGAWPAPLPSGCRTLYDFAHDTVRHAHRISLVAIRP